MSFFLVEAGDDAAAGGRVVSGTIPKIVTQHLDILVYVVSPLSCLFCLLYFAFLPFQGASSPEFRPIARH